MTDIQTAAAVANRKRVKRRAMLFEQSMSRFQQLCSRLDALHNKPPKKCVKVKKLYDLSKNKTRIILNSQLLVKNKIKLVRVEYEKHIHKLNQLMQITKIKDR